MNLGGVYQDAIVIQILFSLFLLSLRGATPGKFWPGTLDGGVKPAVPERWPYQISAI